VQQELVTVHRISQDGTRVRASVGAGSYRRREGLEKLLAETRAHIEELARQVEQPEEQAAVGARRRAARERAARERQQRIEQALAQLSELEKRQQEQAAKKAAKKGVAAQGTEPRGAEAQNAEAQGTAAQGAETQGAVAEGAQPQDPEAQRQLRVSTTDPVIRVMRMPDGGYRPAVNVQLACTPQPSIIVGVAVSPLGVDTGQSEPMREQVERRTGQKVQEHLIDGGYLNFDELERATEQGVTLYVPPKPPRNRNRRDRGSAPRPGDSPAVEAWRARMDSEESKEIYKQRGASSETINADLKTHRGLGQFTVRGLDKIHCAVLWSVLAYNLMRLGWALPG
jgi:hypothetical protein